MPDVALALCKSYQEPELSAQLAQVVARLGGMERFVRPGARVLIKPNLLSAREPQRRVTTDPAVVRAVVRLVQGAGGKPFIADSPGIDPFGRVARKSGLAQVAQEEGVPIEELSDPISIAPPGEPRFRSLEIARQALEAEVVINLPKAKAHCQMLLTLGVKNLFGTIVAQRKVEWHHMAGVDRETFAHLLLDIAATVKPALTILDGVWGMDGSGPSNGNPCRLNFLAASGDPLALDMVVCRLLGVPLKSFPLFRAARQRGLVDDSLSGISTLGDDTAGMVPRGFEVPQLDSMHMLPASLDWFSRRYLVSKPVLRAEACQGCGECARVCPPRAISQGKTITFDYQQCIRCYCCQEICPNDAIGFRRGLLVRLLGSLGR